MYDENNTGGQGNPYEENYTGGNPYNQDYDQQNQNQYGNDPYGNTASDPYAQQ
jgi:hypothetical protein